MSRILVIDDEDVVRMLVMEILEADGHEVVGVDSAEQALALVDDGDFDLVVSDVVMPGLSGLELLEAVRSHSASLPVVLVTGAGTYETLSQALTRGAAGLVTKPFAHAELQSAVADALERSARSREELRERLLAPTLASALANAIEARDSYLHGHCERLAALAVRIAEELGLAAEAVETIRLGAILHDIGKIGIPDRVLLKPGALDAEEETVARTHPDIGDKLLEPLDLLAGARPIVRHHHERWDGAGYPDGLAGEQIPLGARIVSVADSVEVMSSRQLYRRPLDSDGIVAELEAGSAAQWDPRVVQVVLGLIESGELLLSADGLRLLEQAAPDTLPAEITVLLVEGDDDHARLVTQALEHALDGIAVARADSVGAARLMTGADWSLAIVDQALPDGAGIDVLDALRVAHPSIPIVMLTGAGSEETAIEAFRHGASDYVVKGGSYVEALATRVRGLVAV
ncbi:MAG TPA: response regulator [Gaiellaceae bacterium]|jgi:putative two-component system response regulator|nr:response regulator [Gaiellaceae bacterium]